MARPRISLRWQAVAQDRNVMIEWACLRVADGDNDTEDAVLSAFERSKRSHACRPIELDAPGSDHLLDPVPNKCCVVQWIAVSEIGA